MRLSQICGDKRFSFIGIILFGGCFLRRGAKKFINFYFLKKNEMANRSIVCKTILGLQKQSKRGRRIKLTIRNICRIVLIRIKI